MGGEVSVLYTALANWRAGDAGATRGDGGAQVDLRAPRTPAGDPCRLSLLAPDPCQWFAVA